MNPHIFGFLPLFFLSFFSATAQMQIAVDVDPDVPVREEGRILAQPSTISHGKGSGPSTDILQFLTGDRLSGDLRSIQEGLLKWIHPDAREAILLKTSNLQEIVLKGKPNPAILQNLSRVEMTNGDVYRGQFVAMTAEQLILQTPYAAELRLSVPMIQRLRPASSSKILYEGPNSLDEWSFGDKKSWVLKNGSLVSNTGNNSIGRRIENLSDMVTIEVDLAWRGNAQVNVGFWGGNPESIHENSYTLMIQGSYIRLFRYSNTQGGSDLGAFNFEKLQGVNSTRLSLRLDRKRRNIAMLLDGEMVKQWKDTSGEPPSGSALLFQSSSGNGLRLSNIRVSQWDGKLEDKTASVGDALDQAEFTNGDTFSGKLESIADGKMKFVTDFATFEVPVARVTRVDFAPKTRELARRSAGDVEVFFPTDERITLRLESLSPERFSGSSQNAGDVRVGRDFIAKLRFNIYDPRQKKTVEEW